MSSDKQCEERKRLEDAHSNGVAWRKWGPYLSERQWGTVREDYSESGDAWSYFSHDQARSRAYHWGEDGLAGFCDDKQRLCFAIALWNGKDPILKERLFGLTNAEGNHGEDVKEYYFYVDSTPTHSYMKWLYKYPQRAYPYGNLIETNRNRSRTEMEYELLDTGVFNDDRYFDVFAEFAKASPEDILIRITVANRGPDIVELHLLPTFWFRNTWAWWPCPSKPKLHETRGPGGFRLIEASHWEMGDRWIYVKDDVPFLFTENETNNKRLFNGQNASSYVKDGINEYLVNGRTDAVRVSAEGTKAAAHHLLKLGPKESRNVYLRLSDLPPSAIRTPFEDADRIFALRLEEANDFYASVIPSGSSPDAANVMRQSFAGMLWSKQHYFLEAEKWLEEHGASQFSNSRRDVRNADWAHMINDNVISMPDKWEYPWYAAWDLAFHTVVLSAIDLDFAKSQLDLMLREIYLHPTGQIPAYEWNFSDVNPPVHAWASLFIYRMEQAFRGKGDVDFLKRVFVKLLANFTWWVNRKDRFGNNLFEGGFLGLDNIGVFDRSAPLPTGGYLEQADGTAWMSLFCQNMLEIGIEIASYDHAYEDMVAKFIDHFLLIANALNRVGAEGMWDEEDGFYYDILRLPDGSCTRLKVRSMVGLLPLCATTHIEPWQRERVPRLLTYARERLKRMPQLRESIHPTGERHLGCYDRGILAVVNPARLRRILTRMLDEQEFLGPHGIRALSRYHLDHPYVFNVHGQDYRVSYLPAESDTGMFGGNSNWRGPVWMPVNALLIRALLSFYAYYGDNFKIECPTGSGHLMNLFEVAADIARRIGAIFLRDEHGRRPVYGGSEKFQTDPHWRDYLLFYEYFHGDNGAGLGASHQTGWTGLAGSLMRFFGRIDAKGFLELGSGAVFAKQSQPDPAAAHT
ncbi:MAG TPA: glucosidase [Bryobacteraceae bacterium]|nr:glucosidase [Bryobacteraceae bacterium]